MHVSAISQIFTKHSHGFFRLTFIFPILRITFLILGLSYIKGSSSYRTRCSLQLEIWYTYSIYAWHQCQITMPTKPCIGPAASLYRERFDLSRHHGMSVLTFSGSRGSEGTLVKQQSSHFDPLWYTTQGMLLIYPGCWYLVLLEQL